MADLPEAFARLLGIQPKTSIDVKGSPAPTQAPIPFSVPSIPTTPAVIKTTSGLFGGIKTAGKKSKKKAEPNPSAPSLASILGVAEEDLQYRKGSKVSEAIRRCGVQNSPELDRILAIERRHLNLENYPIDLTDKYKKPEGTMSLWPIQSAMLVEAALSGGLLGPVAAGSGKTLASLLIGAATNATKIVLLVPPQLRSQLMSVDIPRLNKHWKLPLERLRVVAYSELSNAASADILDQIKPDLIVADEAHCLKARTAARTKRFNRYFKEHPECRFVGLSGTITRKSLRDYCLAPDTKVLKSDLTWVPVETLKTGDELIGFDEELGRKCKLRGALVEGLRHVDQRRLKITTSRGVIVCSDLHGYVRCSRPNSKYKGENDNALNVRPTWRVTRHWAQAKDLRIGDELAFLTDPWKEDVSREGGYMAGLLDGEGWVYEKHGVVGFAQNDGVILDYYCDALTRQGFTFSRRGHNTTLKDGSVKRACYRVIPNGEAPNMRLLGLYRPLRLMQKARSTWEDKAPWGRNSSKAVVLSIEDLGVGEVVAVQTFAKTLIAEGFLTHNSHLSELALKKNSPLPDHYPTLNEWAEAIDVGDDPMPPGMLLRLCNDAERAIAEDPKAAISTEARKAAHEAVRSGFRRRLIETPGVVATSESAVGTSLVISALRPIVPEAVQRALIDLRVKWEIDGDELTDILEVSRIARQLAAGIFSRWKWPGGIVDTEWLGARSAWHKEIREVLKQSRRGMDSPLLVTNAVLAGKYHSESYWNWAEVRKKYTSPSGTITEPPRETIWISDFLVKYAVDWCRENATKTAPVICWYSHVAIGEAIAKLGGFPFFGAGAKASEDLTKVNTQKTPVIVCSIKAHGTGKNLQAFNKNLMTTCISSGADMEQLIARTHRPGQDADEVTMDICVHTPELQDAFASALMDAAYIEQSQGQRQKLNFAQLVGFGNAR